MMKFKLAVGMLSVFWVCGLAQAQISLPNFPVAIEPRDGCAIPRIDGDKVPFPLKTANTKFELAENETYLLNGFLQKVENRWMFRVDFQSQPWLATSHRIQFPMFPVEIDETPVGLLQPGTLVQMAVVVRKADPLTSGNEMGEPMKLETILPPVKVSVRQGPASF